MAVSAVPKHPSGWEGKFVVGVAISLDGLVAAGLAQALNTNTRANKITSRFVILMSASFDFDTLYYDIIHPITIIIFQPEYLQKMVIQKPSRLGGFLISNKWF
ncbi:MAG: hypothetical protein AB1457_02920 [Chloroflexota bacterium]